jgi:eukaryotic-like serine/threonine-protein kinase
MDTVEHARLLAGRYRLDSVIGRGGMGTVWRARDELLNRDVAVKEIAWPPSLDEAERLTVRRRALREAQMAARLRHPGVVLIYDIIEEDDRPWIVMELLRYRSLRDIVVEDGPLPPAQAAQLGLGILAALRAAHAEGVLHRDVKPANILAGPDGRVVLTDFGIARAADSPTLTNSGLLIGSPSYIAPEHARGGHASPAGDLWGLGACLYMAVEGRPPFEREGALATLTAVVVDEPDPAPHAGALSPVISGLLRKDPARRFGPDETERMLRRVAPEGGGRPRWLGGLTRRASSVAAPWSPAEPSAHHAAAMPALPPDAQQAPPPPAPEQPVPAAQAPPAPATSPQAVIPATEPEGQPAAMPAQRPDPEVPRDRETVAWESRATKAEDFGPRAPEVLPREAELPEPEVSRLPLPEPPVPEPPVPEPPVLEPPFPEPPVSEPLVPESPVPEPPRRGSRRTRGLLAAAAAVIAAAGTAVALTLNGSPGHPSASPPVSPRPSASTGSAGSPASRSGTAASPSGSATSPSGRPSGSATSPSAAPSSPSSGPPAGSTGGGALPVGYYRFTNSTGFSIGVPQGWQISHVGHYVYIRNPANSGIYLLIDQSDSPKADPLADWRQQEANRAGTYAGYHRIRLESVNYPPAEKAADWEFTYYSNGVLTHVLNRNVRANAHHAYALYWATPQGDWSADYHYFQAFAATFRPAAP